MTPLRSRAAARGFTLIEMLVVLGIVGILAGAAVPLHELTQRRLRESALREGLRTLRTALDAHRAAVESRRIAAGPEGSPWPASLEVLVNGVPLLPEPTEGAAPGAPAAASLGLADAAGSAAAPRRLYLLRRLPRDPFADPALPAAATWALRSSGSPPGQFGAGGDVFDVASRQPGRALDGTRYQDW